MVYASKELAGQHYADDEAWLNSVGQKTRSSYEKKGITLPETDKEIGQKIRQQLMDFISMSPSVAIVFEGYNAVAHVRKVIGATSPSDSMPGTIRGDYSFDAYQLADNLKRPIQNLIHASGAVEEAEREIKLWFTDDELHAWKRVDEDLIYRKGE
jgi:nucleoside-diphosphate kinase